MQKDRLALWAILFIVYAIGSIYSIENFVLVAGLPLLFLSFLGAFKAGKEKKNSLFAVFVWFILVLAMLLAEQPIDMIVTLALIILSFKGLGGKKVI